MRSFVIFVLLLTLKCVLLSLSVTCSSSVSFHRPRKLHRYVNTSKSVSPTAKPALPTTASNSSDSSPQHIEHDYKRVYDHHIEDVHIEPSYAPTHVAAVDSPAAVKASTTWQGPDQALFEAICTLHAARWNEEVKSIVSELDDLLFDAANQAEDWLRLRHELHSQLHVLRRTVLSHSHSLQKKKKSRTSTSLAAKSSTSAPPVTAVELVIQDFRAVNTWQLQLTRNLQNYCTFSYSQVTDLAREVKELQSSLFRTEMALRESKRENDNLESKIVLLNSQKPDNLQINRLAALSDPILLLALDSRHKYESETDQVIERLEGQLRNLTIQLSINNKY